MHTNRRRTAVPRTLPFGSIISGTCRDEDIIPALLDMGDPRYLRMSRADRKRYRVLASDWARMAAFNEDEDPTRGDTTEPEMDLIEYVQSGEFTMDLITLLESYCPSYAYLGSHYGDGADTGVWLSEDSPGGDLAGFDGLKVGDLAEVPRGFSGEVLHVNDHGNCTLYAYSRGRGREIWALV